MKKIKEIIGFDDLYVYNNSIIVKNKTSIQIINNETNMTPLVEGNIFVVKVLENDLFYQLENECNIHIYGRNIVLKDDFAYGLITALKCYIYIYIYGGKDGISMFLDSNLHFIGMAPEKCSFSYKQYLIRNNNLKKIFICYKLYENIWDYKHMDGSNIHIISGYKDKILIYSENGDYLALNLQDGNIAWKYPERCYTTNSLYGDYLYTLDQNNLIEIDAETGKKNQTIDIKSIEDKEKFLINRIKVYDDYVFCIDTFGTIAVIDRKTLSIKKMLRLNNHLRNGEHSLQWLNNRLYVQDVEHVIHIFEEE